MNDEDDLACHASVRERLLRASCVGQRKSLRDERLDLLLLKKIKQGDQILSNNAGFSRLSVQAGEERLPTGFALARIAMHRLPDSCVEEPLHHVGAAHAERIVEALLRPSG